jgi:hypothetical protein
MKKNKDYRVELVKELIENLKDMNYRVKSIEIAEHVVQLMDKIQGVEYAHKINHFKEEARNFHKV